MEHKQNEGYVIVSSLRCVHGEVYLIQHCMIKFVSDLRQVGGFFPPEYSGFNHQDITEILLIVAFNTINKQIIRSCCLLSFWLEESGQRGGATSYIKVYTDVTHYINGLKFLSCDKSMVYIFKSP